MRVAVIHFGKSSDLDENERNLSRLNLEAVKYGADLIVNPELSILPLSPPSAPIKLSSTANNVAESKAYAKWFAKERCPKLIESFIDEIAVPYKKYIVLGVITHDPEFHILRNSALVIGPKSANVPDGIYHVYHKRTLHGDIFAMRGSSPLQPAHLDIGAIGVMICSDYSVPLISRALALNGSDIIVIPTSITSQTSDTIKARALENGIPLAIANCYEHDKVYSDEWIPESAIVGADATVTDSFNKCEDTILYRDFNLLDGEATRAKKDKVKRRRPDLYESALIDVTSPVLRSACSLPDKSEVCVITLSGAAIEGCVVSNEGRDLIAKSSKECAPVIVVLPELPCERKAVQKNLDFMKEQQVYVACSFLEDSHRVISLFHPYGQELLTYKKVHLSDDDKRNGLHAGNRLEFYFDLPVGRIGILAGEDLLFPEALEAHRNAAVDIILVSSSLNSDYRVIFKDIAESRHMSVAIADYQSKGGIYKRAPEGRVSNERFINYMKFDTQEGRIEPPKGLPSISLCGFEAIVRKADSGTEEPHTKEDAC